MGLSPGKARSASPCPRCAPGMTSSFFSEEVDTAVPDRPWPTWGREQIHAGEAKQSCLSSVDSREVSVAATDSKVPP
jgi:hypothetical protein